MREKLENYFAFMVWIILLNHEPTLDSSSNSNSNPNSALARGVISFFSRLESIEDKSTEYPNKI